MAKYYPTPVQDQFMCSDKYVRVLAGPIGSGKSVTCVHELIRLMVEQEANAAGVRKTRMLIVRNTSDQLAQTTRKTVFEWLPPNDGAVWHAVPKTYHIKVKLADGTRVDSEWLFIALDTPDDVRKALSLEATALWGNEARELHPEVVDGLLGRINRYPSPNDGGATRACAIFDTNMPDEDTWWWESMENPPQTWSVHVQPPAIIGTDEFARRYGDEPQEIALFNGKVYYVDPAEPLVDKDGEKWLVNPAADNLRFLARDYYQNQIPGKSADWLRVYLRSIYGRSLSGTPVYEKTFIPEFHLADAPLQPMPSEAYPVVIGVDFGRTPAAVFKQRDPRGRVLTLSEVVSENMGIETFIKTKLNPHIAQRYIGCSFVVAPDPAGFFKQQQNEMSLVDVLRQAGFKCVKPPTNNPELRVQAVERLLNQQVGGKAMYLVDKDHCPTLVKGFRYGYRYKIRKSGDMEDRPDKNSFSHVHDANQYADAVIDMNLRGVALSTAKRTVKKVEYVYS